MSLGAKFYVAAFCALGACAWTLAFLHSDISHGGYFLLYLFGACASSGMKINLPSIKGTLSVNFLFILLGISELSFLETLILGSAAIFWQYVWKAKEKREFVKISFNLGSSASAVAAAVAAYQAAGLWSPSWDPEWLARVLALLKPRVRTLEDVVTQGRPFFDPADTFAYEPAAEAKHLKGERLPEAMAALRGRLAAVPRWTAPALETALRETADAHGIGWGKLIHPTRLAVTGMGASPGLFEVLELLGRERTLARLDRLKDRLVRA